MINSLRFLLMYFACHNVLIEDRFGLQTVSPVHFYCEATMLLVIRTRFGITSWVVLYLLILRYIYVCSVCECHLYNTQVYFISGRKWMD